MSDRKKIVLTAVITAVVTAFISCSATSFIKDKIAIYLPSEDEDKAFSNKLSAIESILSTKYLYDYDKQELRDTAIKSYVEQLGEPYTHYYPASEFSSYISNIQDSYVGIGVVVAINDKNQIEVIAPFEGSPAFDAGVKPGDILKSVNGVDYNGEQMTEAVNVIKAGEIGTTVELTVVRDNQDINITVERQDISSESVTGEIIDDSIGYIRVTGFNMESENGEHSTFSEFKEEMLKLQESGMDRVIIDLRDNPGGVLDEVCEMADMILPEGVITYTETKDGQKKYYNSDAECIDLPMVILINENSASASEVFTGALKDYGKATVIGQTSYGKGIVQDVLPFYDGSGISFTSAKYYTPNGICIHDVGIEPDIAVELPEELKDAHTSMIEREEDTQLQKAIEVIKEK